MLNLDEDRNIFWIPHQRPQNKVALLNQKYNFPTNRRLIYIEIDKISLKISSFDEYMFIKLETNVLKCKKL